MAWLHSQNMGMPGRHHTVSHLDYILGHHITVHLRVFQAKKAGRGGMEQGKNNTKNADQPGGERMGALSSQFGDVKIPPTSRATSLATASMTTQAV